MKTLLSPSRVQTLLEVDDLTKCPGHALHLMVQEVASSVLSTHPVERVDGPAIVQARHNYELLGYPPGSIVQESTYTHWVDDAHILRTQTTSLVLEALLRHSQAPRPVVLLAPGLVYRRDVRDRWHSPQPHQVDLWCLTPKKESTVEALVHQALRLVKTTTGLSEEKVQIIPASHPYTEKGIEVSVRWQDRWLEVGEAGLISPSLLGRLGIDSEHWGGLAMGWGLDRLVMARKGLPDIRLLRDPLPAVAQQMTNLEPWKPVSRQPAASREISVVLDSGAREEDIAEKVLASLDGADADLVQSIDVLGRWPVSSLGESARQRLGGREDQENVLLKIVWQSESHSLERRLVNASMGRIYRHIHQGSAWDYCP